MLELSKTKTTHQLGATFYLFPLPLFLSFDFLCRPIQRSPRMALAAYFIQQLSNPEFGKKEYQFLIA